MPTIGEQFGVSSAVEFASAPPPPEALEPWDDLEAQQAVLEIAMDVRGAHRARKADRFAERAGAPETSATGRAFVAGAIESLAAAIASHLAAHPCDRAGRRETAATLLDGVGPEVVAALTLRASLGALTTPTPVTRLAQKVSELIEYEVRAAAFAGGDRAMRRRLKRISREPSAARRRRRLIAAERSADSVRPRWTLTERQRVGLRLIDLLIAQIGAHEIYDVVESGRSVKMIGASLRGALAFERAQAIALHERPLYEPMVAPPTRWRAADEGGYRTRHARPLTLVKSSASTQAARLTPDAAPQIYSAVNRAQATPWAINRPVLDILLRLRAGEVGEDAAAAAGLASAEAAPDPELEVSQPDMDREEHGRAGRRRAVWSEFERARRSRRLAQDAMVATARRFERFERIYFPHQYDFRGRMYAATTFSPQGPDPMRALLRFGEGKRLGDEGGFWLAVHLCNCGDFEKMSKAPLRDRAIWTCDNEQRILTVAEDPLSDLFWTEADKPWQFLAACFEWRGFVEQGSAFESHLPIALDGSCSGLQHFSLALRDEVCGGAVNLEPADEAADIYTRVADTVRSMVAADLESVETLSIGKDVDGAPRTVAVADLARRWLCFGIDRSLVKRPTMTYGYGARGYGYTEQLMQDALRPAFARACEATGDDAAGPDALAAAGWPFEGRGFEAALYLGRRLLEAVERVVLRAADAMRWLQASASIAAEEGAPLSWTTPDGFPVVQAYPKLEARRVKTTMSGDIVKLSLREPTGDLDPRRQRQGAAPNFVHSLDASHLRATVNKAADEGVDAFQLIHDSFGVHAAHTSRFFEIVRETMVEMYGAVDVMRSFHEDVSAALSEDGRRRLAAPPEKGALRIEGVLDSEFCFA